MAKLNKLFSRSMRDAFARARERLRGYGHDELMSFGLNRYRIAAGERPVRIVVDDSPTPPAAACCLCGTPAREILETINGQPQPLCSRHLGELEKNI